jgi:hypothetical protein
MTNGGLDVDYPDDEGSQRNDEKALISYAVESIRSMHLTNTNDYSRLFEIQVDQRLSSYKRWSEPWRAGIVILSAMEIDWYLSDAEQDSMALFRRPPSRLPTGYVGTGGGEVCAEIVLKFLRHWFAEIRAIICEGERLGAATKAADLSSKTIATAIAVWLSNMFGMSSPVAAGLATLILLVLGQAAKEAFCQMTQDQIVSRVTDKLEDKTDGRLLSYVSDVPGEPT